MEKQWYAFYTKSRWEKKIMDRLTKAGSEVFLPMQNVLRQWSDRKKKVQMPLFNSYIFVKTLENEVYRVLQEPGVVKSIVYNGKPAYLRGYEYEIINRWLETGMTIETEAIDHTLKPGNKVKVLEGPMKGVVGEVKEMDNETICSVVIESLNQVMMVRLHKGLLYSLE